MDPTAKEYVPMPISEFAKGAAVPVDLYLRVSDDKFILIVKAGVKGDLDQLRNYRDKEVHYLWIHKSEFAKLAHAQLSLAGIALSKNDLDGKQRTFLVSHAARSTFRQLEHLGMDLEIYNNAKHLTDAVIGLAERHNILADLFVSLSGVNDQLLSHSIAVSAISVMIGVEMGFTKRQTLEKLATGGLLHDIGKKGLPRELLEKPMSSMTAEELQLYETHAYRGSQMLQALGVVPDDVVAIVYEHHENSLGQGYPQRLRDMKIHPLARIIALADGFIDLTLANVNCPNPKTAAEATSFIENTLGVPYNRDCFKALKRVFLDEAPATKSGSQKPGAA